VTAGTYLCTSDTVRHQAWYLAGGSHSSGYSDDGPNGPVTVRSYVPLYLQLRGLRRACTPVGFHRSARRGYDTGRFGRLRRTRRRTSKGDHRDVCVLEPVRGRSPQLQGCLPRGASRYVDRVDGQLPADLQGVLSTRSNSRLSRGPPSHHQSRPSRTSG
jgi:hypothetical protein